MDVLGIYGIWITKKVMVMLTTKAKKLNNLKAAACNDQSKP
jgi:hypothetical protein